MGALRPRSPNSHESSNGKRTATRSHAARSNSTQQSPTVYLHRHLAHRGVELRPEVRGASRFLIWVSSGMKPRQWTQVHRYHHAGEDTPNDPHSPTNFGGGRRGARYVFWHNGRCTRGRRATRTSRRSTATLLRIAGTAGSSTTDKWECFLASRSHVPDGAHRPCTRRRMDRSERRDRLRSGRCRAALRVLPARGRHDQRLRPRRRRPPTPKRIRAEHAGHRVADRGRRMASQPPRRRELPSPRTWSSTRPRLGRHQWSTPPSTRSPHHPRNRRTQPPRSLHAPSTA
jgi:hypothetical protein